MDKMRYVFFAYIKGFEAGYEKGYTDFPRDYRDGDIYRIVDRGLYSIPLEELGLCNRTYNSLKCAGYRCIDDIASLHKERILAIRGMDKKVWTRWPVLCISWPFFTPPGMNFGCRGLNPGARYG